MKIDLIESQMDIEIMAKHFYYPDYEIITLSPVLKQYADIVVSLGKNSREHVQEIEDIFFELFSTGKYNCSDALFFLSYMTRNNIMISYEIYPWFKDVIVYCQPRIIKAKQLWSTMKNQKY